MELDDKYPWRTQGYSLDAINPVTSMIGPDESFYLHWLAREYYRGDGEIIDGGCLLGGSTVSLASGLRHNTQALNKAQRIHSYDLFSYSSGFKGTILPDAVSYKDGDSILPIFLNNIYEYANYVRINPGDILNTKWDRKAIEILFIDVSKSWQINNHILAQFFTCMIPGRSIVVQQDYYHYYCYWIHLTMEYFSDYFKVVHEPDGGSVGFLLTKKIPDELLRVDLNSSLETEYAVRLMDRAIEKRPEYLRLYLMAAKVRLLADRKEYERAYAVCREIRQAPDWQDQVLYDVAQAESQLPSELVFRGIQKEKVAGVSRFHDIVCDSGFYRAIPREIFGHAGDYRQAGEFKAATLDELKENIGAVIELANPLPKRFADEAGRGGAAGDGDSHPVVPRMADAMRPNRKTGKRAGPEFSLILPTRGRPELLGRLFDSIMDTTAAIENIEVVLGIDDDDIETQRVSHESLVIKKAIVPRGSTMGSIVDACFQSSSGRYIAGINDDVILRTPEWDKIVSNIYGKYADDILLIHTNDLIFKERLCTFPILSRRACLEIGICPGFYRRYKIDDHIYDTYNLLSHLGYTRIIYVPELIFEHTNYSENHDQSIPSFISDDNRVYAPDKEIIQYDDAIFGNLFDMRKEMAIKLAKLIDSDKRDADKIRNEYSYSSRLNGVKELYNYRRPNYVKKYRLSNDEYSNDSRVTIIVATSDIRKQYAQTCLSLIKEHTSNYELMILDNSNSPGFSHPREINRALKMVDSDYVVFMDDDVFVDKGWLEGLRGCMDQNVGVVVPMHKDKEGNLNYSGAYLAGDGLGNHEHLSDVPSGPRATQGVCTALVLVDRNKCGGIFMDEQYSKYFFDIAYGLKVWESGYMAVCTPDVTVTHLGGATMARSTTQSGQLWERDRIIFVEEWVKTGRLANLENGIWRKYGEIKYLVDIPERIHRCFSHGLEMDFDEFRNELTQLGAISEPFGLFGNLLQRKMIEIIPVLFQGNDAQKAYLCLKILLSPMDVKQKLRRLAYLSDALMSRNQPEAAMGLIEMGLKIDPFEPDLLKRLAINHHVRGDVLHAEEAFKTAIRFAPEDIDLLVSLGKIYSDTHRFGEAIECFRRVVDLNAEDVDAHLGIATVALLRKDKEGFRRAYMDLILIDPGHPMVVALNRASHSSGLIQADEMAPPINGGFQTAASTASTSASTGFQISEIENRETSNLSPPPLCDPGLPPPAELDRLEEFYSRKLRSIDPGLIGNIPDFLIISPPKTGTTWLSNKLSAHPAIFIPKIKELNYFCSLWKSFDVNWYLNFFKNAEHLKKGEASPNYALLPEAYIKTIRRIMPDVRLIFFIRDPVERAWSHAKHCFRYHEASFRDFEGVYEDISSDQWIECLTHEWCLAAGDYLGSLKRWMKYFPKSSFHINVFDSIKKNPEDLLRDISNHIGVGFDFDWSGIDTKEVVFKGIEGEIPETVISFLKKFYRPEVESLKKFMENEFGVGIPGEWENYDPDNGIISAGNPRGFVPGVYDDLALVSILDKNCSIFAPHMLVEEGFHGFNIVHYENRFYALAISLGEFDVDKVEESLLKKCQENKMCFIGDSEVEVKELVSKWRHHGAYLKLA